MPAIEPESTGRVTLDGASLREAIQAATHDVRSETAEIRIDLEGGDLIFRGPGAEGMARAEGIWKGHAFVQAVPLKRMVPRLPRSGPITLEVRGGRMAIGTASFSARWQDIAAAPVETPIGMSHMDYLVLSKQRSFAEIQSSGLASYIERAQVDLRKRAAKAAHELRAYGVTVKDLTDMVMQRAAQIVETGKK